METDGKGAKAAGGGKGQWVGEYVSSEGGTTGTAKLAMLEGKELSKRGSVMND